LENKYFNKELEEIEKEHKKERANKLYGDLIK
jgi:hypothetical protein